MSLELVRAYGFARQIGPSVEDRRKFGVPVGGPFDREACLLAKALARQPKTDLVWELGMADAVFRCISSGVVAIVGAPGAVSLNGENRPFQSVFPVRKGSELHISPSSAGARAYLAWHERLDGVNASRRLAAPPESLATGPLRVVPGPQNDSFNLGGLAAKSFQVGHASDRVGVRLDGILQPHDIELPSEPACVGAIQVTGSGELVILGPDGPTIGGYPKVAVVIDADLDRVGQLRPADATTFEVVTLDQARELRRARQTRIASTLANLGLALG